MNDQRWVDVSHEALIRGWPRLRRWIEENRSGLRVHRRLTEAALEWDKTGKDHSSLYRGARLAQATEWRQTNEASLNDLERAFLDASVALERYEIESRERQRRRIIAGLSIALVIFAFLAVLAVLQWHQANERGQIALARQLAAQADLLRDQPELMSRRLALAAEAMRRLHAVEAHSLEVDATLRREIALSSRHIARFPVAVKGLVRDMRLSPDGRFVMGGNYFDGFASIWEIATGKELVRIEISARDVTVTRLGQEPVRMQVEGMGGNSQIQGLSTDGQVLVTVNGDGSVDVVQAWETATGRELLRVELRGSSRYALSDDGRYLAASTSLFDNATNKWSEATTRVWDVGARTEISGSVPDDIVRGFGQGTRFGIGKAAIVTPSGQRLIVTGSVDGKIVDVWERRAEGGPVITIQHAIHVVAVGLTPQGRLTTIAHDGKKMIAHTWDVDTGQEKPDLAKDLDGYGAIFAPDGLTFAVMDTSGLEVRRVDDPQPMAQLDHEVPDVVAWSPNGRYIAASTEGKARVGVWDLSSRRSVGQLELPGQPTALALASGGDALAAVVASGEQTRSGEVHWAKLLKVSNGKELSSFEPDQGQIRQDTHCALDARYLVTRDLDVLKMESGASVFRLGLDEGMTDCVLSTDGRYLAASSSGGEMVRVWELERGKKAFQIPTKDRPLAFDQESRYLATIGEDKTVRVWSLRQDDLIAEACRRLPRNLSEPEWREYVGDEAYHKTCPQLP